MQRVFSGKLFQASKTFGKAFGKSCRGGKRGWLNLEQHKVVRAAITWDTAGSSCSSVSLRFCVV